MHEMDEERVKYESRDAECNRVAQQFKYMRKERLHWEWMAFGRETGRYQARPQSWRA